MFAEGEPDLVIGRSSVTIEDDGTYTLVARIQSETGGSPLTLDLRVAAGSRRYLPPVEIGGEGIVSGYTVPLLDARATGRLCEGSRCREIDGSRTYHDHNWGTWGGVTWDWGQAWVGGYSVLYGGVRGGDPDRTATGPRILHLTDEHGFAGIFSIRRLGDVVAGRGRQSGCTRFDLDSRHEWGRFGRVEGRSGAQPRDTRPGRRGRLGRALLPDAGFGRAAAS